MKKILCLFLCILLVGGCANKEIGIESNNNQNNNIANEPDIKEINTEELKNIVGSKDAVIIYAGRPTCPNCADFYPILEEFSKENKITIYYLNTSNVTAQDWEEIDKIVLIEYVPTIIVAKNNEILVNTYNIRTKSDLDSLKTEYNLK